MNKKVLLIVVVILYTVSSGFGIYTIANLSTKGITKVENLKFGSLGIIILDDEKKDTSLMGEAIIKNSNFYREKNIKIQNTGSLPGRLFIRLVNVKNEENGCNEAEKETEPGCELDNVGELGKNMKFSVDFGREVVAETNLDTLSANNFEKVWKLVPPVIVIGESNLNLHLKINLGQKPFGNEVQSDKMSFDIEYRLDQI